MAVCTKLSRDADGVDEEERRKMRLDDPGCVAASVRVRSRREP